MQWSKFHTIDFGLTYCLIFKTVAIKYNFHEMYHAIFRSHSFNTSGGYMYMYITEEVVSL